MNGDATAGTPGPHGRLAEDLGRGAQARLALIHAAVEVFGESGLEAATTRDIAQRAQQNIAAIAYYFGGKEGLYLAVVEHIVQVILARVGPPDGRGRGVPDARGAASRALPRLPEAAAGALDRYQPGP